MSELIIEEVFRVRNSKTGDPMIFQTREAAEAHIRKASFERKAQVTSGVDAGTARMCLNNAEKMIALLMQYLMGDPAPTNLRDLMTRHATAEAYVKWLGDRVRDRAAADAVEATDDD